MREQLKQRFKNMKLERKMTLVYLLFVGISSCISIIGLQASMNIYDKKLYEKSLQELDFFIQEVNDGLEEIENLSYTLAMDPEVQEHLVRAQATPYLSQEYYYELYHLQRIFIDEINTHFIVKNVMYLDGRNIKFPVGIDCGPISDKTYQNLLERYGEARGGYVIEHPTEEYPYLLSGRDILERKNASLLYLGSLVLTSDVSGMIERKKKALEFESSNLIVYSDDGVIYNDKNETLNIPEFEEKQGYQVIRREGEQYFMCYLKSSFNNWTYVNFFPYSKIFGQTTMVRYLMLGALLLVFLLTNLAVRKIAHIITNPLNQLTDSVQMVEKVGDFQKAKDLLPQENRHDEAGILAQEFRVMLDRISELIHKNYEKQILLTDTKYRMLQAQINPHFLYNTLNAVNWMIKAERNQEAGKMIVELGQLLRASFSNKTCVTLAEELDSARSYITIQQFRYQKRVKFEVEIDKKLESYMVPCMILQPLIENAIYYGVEKSLVCCRITIKIIEKNHRIVLEVQDTGAGMSPEELENVRNLTMKPKGHGIGLKNIRERLKIIYSDSEMFIDSEPGEGTRVTIWIPKEKKGE